MAVAAVAMSLGCNEPAPARPPALACTALDGGCSSGPIGGAGGGGTVSDAGTSTRIDVGQASDAVAAADAGVVRVSGRVALFPSVANLGQSTTSVAPTGWTVSVLDVPDLSAELDPMGNFLFEAVPLTSVEGGARYYGILASPSGRDLRSLRVFDAAVSSVVIPALTLDAMQSAVVGAMGLVQPEAAHIVMMTRESADPSARGLAGVRVQPVSEPSAVYYDSMLNPESLQVSDAQTGANGLAVVLNLTAPPMGVREVGLQVTGPGGSVMARVPVMARTITWLTYVPGR